MGGTIHAESTVGQGSAFWFDIPLRAPTGEPRHKTQLAELAGKRVLAVDDHPTNRRLIELLLDEWQCVPLLAEQSEIAWRILEEEYRSGRRIDLIITDMQMPDVDGETFGKRVKADARFKDIPLVMLTSMGQRGEADRLMREGFSAYLTKPVGNTQLLRCLQTVLGGKASDTAGQKLVTRHSLAEDRRAGRILLVEDNPTNQLVARRMLEKQGHAISVAEDGRAALACLAREPFDLVLMDCQMPVMDGYEATRALRQGEHGVLDPHIPVIALTANAMQGDRDRAMSAGMNDHVAKPFSAAQLQRVVDTWLANASPPAAKVEPAAGSADNAQAHAIPAFDAKAMMLGFGDDIEIAHELLPSGLDDLGSQAAQLGAALKSGDTATAARIAHTIKGLSATFGGMSGSRIAADLERQLKVDELADAESKLVALHAELAQMRVAAEDWIATTK